MGIWAAKPMVKLAMAGEERVPPEPCVKIRVGDINIDDDDVVGAFSFLLFSFSAMTCCFVMLVEHFGVLDFSDGVFVGGVERTQGIDLGEKGRSKWSCCGSIYYYRFVSTYVRISTLNGESRSIWICNQYSAPWL